MKICLIAEGKLPIPPQGWGGVEHLIWNFKQQLNGFFSGFYRRASRIFKDIQLDHVI